MFFFSICFSKLIFPNYFPTWGFTPLLLLLTLLDTLPPTPLKKDSGKQQQPTDDTDDTDDTGDLLLLLFLIFIIYP